MYLKVKTVKQVMNSIVLCNSKIHKLLDAGSRREYMRAVCSCDGYSLKRGVDVTQTLVVNYDPLFL